MSWTDWIHSISGMIMLPYMVIVMVLVWKIHNNLKRLVRK